MRILPLFLIILIPLATPAQDINSHLASLKTSDAGNKYRAIKNLQHLAKDMFDKEALQVIISEIKKAPPHVGELLKLAGYLQIEEANPFIWSITDSSRFSYRDRWAAYLALARMNDEKAIAFVNKKVTNLQINDAFVYNIVPEVIYTRNRKLFDYLITVLEDDTPYCTSANPDSEVQIACGYRIMEYLAPVIENYHLQLTVSGDLDTDDYKKALVEVRQWFAENGNYKIIKDKF